MQYNLQNQHQRGISVTIFCSFPIKALIKDDFPTFGLPITANFGVSSSSRNVMRCVEKAVITIGGIYGKITDVKEDAFVIEVHGGTKLKVAKTAVSMTGDAGIEQK